MNPWTRATQGCKLSSCVSEIGEMDVVLAVQQYVARMTDGVSGMKALLLDKEV